MSVAVIKYDPLHGSMGTGRTRTAGGGGARALQRARVRADHRHGDRQAGRRHRADLLPILRRQARGALLRRRRAQGAAGEQRRRCPGLDIPDRCGGRCPGGCRRHAAGAPRLRPQAPGRHHRQRGAAGARVDQALVTRGGDGRACCGRAASPTRQPASPPRPGSRRSRSRSRPGSAQPTTETCRRSSGSRSRRCSR